MPAPAEWVTVRRVRIKDSFEHVWWLSKTSFPKADNRNVLRPYSADMLHLAKRSVKATVRPSGHNIKASFNKIDSGGSIPSNVLEDQVANEMLIAGNNSANDPYTMRCKEVRLGGSRDRGRSPDRRRRYSFHRARRVVSPRGPAALFRPCAVARRLRVAAIPHGALDDAGRPRDAKGGDLPDLAQGVR